MNILLTSVGRRSYLVQYFKTVLKGRGRVYVSNSSACSPAFTIADGATVTPLIYDEGYIPFLLSYCKKHQIKMVISLFDIDLPVLAAHKQMFIEQGIALIISDCKVIQICNDKWETTRFLAEHQFLVPQTYLSLSAATADLASRNLHFPVFIKPRWGMGSLGIYQAENQEELEVFYRKCQRDIENSYLRYEAAADQNHAVIIQEQISGQEYGLDVINDLQGEYQATIVKQKIAMRSGETDCAKVVEHPLLERLGQKLALALRHVGNLDVDILYRDEMAYVIDLNARFGGGYPYSHMAGVNLPQLLVDWVEGQSGNPADLKAAVGGCYCKDLVMTRLIDELD